MTQHSIEELKRQRDAAKSRKINADIELGYTEKRLHDAMCKDSGLMGKTITGRKGVKILVHDVEFSGRDPWRLKGFAYKTDGTVGFSERVVYMSDIAQEEAA